jgi:hypothetical protein
VTEGFTIDKNRAVETEKCYIYSLVSYYPSFLCCPLPSSSSSSTCSIHQPQPRLHPTDNPHRTTFCTRSRHPSFSLKPSHQVSSCADRCIYTFSLKRLLCHIASLAEMEEVLSGPTGGVKNNGRTPKRTTQVSSGWYDDDGNDVFVSVFEFSPSPGIEARYGYLESNSLWKAC